MTRTCIKRAKKRSPCDMINASFVAGTVCKNNLIAVQLNLTVIIRAENKKNKKQDICVNNYFLKDPRTTNFSVRKKCR